MPRLVVIGVVILALISAALVVLVPRWTVVPGAVLADPGFATLADEGDSAVWRQVGEGRIEPIPGGVRLVNDDPNAVVGLDQLIRIPPGAQAFRVTATVTLTDVVAGPERWHRPRVVVQGVTPDGRADIGGRFQLIDRDGDHGPTRLSAVFPVASPSDEARVILRLFKATGAMEISDLVVEAAVKPPARDLLRRSLIVVWLAIGSGIGLALWWQSEDKLAASLVLGGLGTLALMVLLPNAVRQPLHDLLGGVAGNAWFDALKPLVHLLGFAALALASRLAQPGRPLGFFAAAWLAAAVLLELAEVYFSRFDGSDILDMAFNATGAMLGLALAGRLLRLRQDRAGSPPDPAASLAFRRRPRPRASPSP